MSFVRKTCLGRDNTGKMYKENVTWDGTVWAKHNALWDLFQEFSCKNIKTKEAQPISDCNALDLRLYEGYIKLSTG